MYEGESDYGSSSGSGSGFESSGDLASDELYDEENSWAYFIPLCVLAKVIIVVNGCTLILVWRNIKLRSNCNAMLVSLALADATTGLVGIPLFVVLNVGQHLISESHFCFVILVLHTWFWFLSILSMFHLLVIACEQYLAILKPFNHDKIVTKTSTTVILVIIWFVSIGHSLIRWSWKLRLGNEFCFIEDKSAERSDKIYTVFSIVTFFLLPIGIILYVYYRIVSEAKRQLARIKRASVCSKGKYPNLSSCTRFRGFYIIALMVIVFVLCWAPYFGSVFYETFHDHIHSFGVSYMLTVLRFLPSVLNPIMFAFWRSDFHAACIEKFCCFVKVGDCSRSSMSGGKQQIPLINRLSESKDTKPVNV